MSAIQQILSSIGSTPAATLPVDLFVNFENGTSGSLVTTGILSGGTQGASGAWSISYGGSGTNHTKISSSNYARRTPVKAGGVVYDGSGTRGVNFDMSARTGLDSAFQTLTWTPVGSFGAVALTALMKFAAVGDPSDNIDTSIDHFVLNAGGFSVLQQLVPSGEHTTAGYVRSHGGDGSGSNFGPTIPIVAGTLYFVALLMDVANQLSQVIVLDGTSYAFVGASQCASASLTTFASVEIQDYLESFGGSTLIDSISLDWTNAAFPGEAFTVPTPTIGVVQNGSGAIAIQWSKVYSLSYLLERSHNGGAYSSVETTTGLSYQDSGLTNGDSYTYRITAKVNAFNSAPAISSAITVNNSATGTLWQSQTNNNYGGIFFNAFGHTLAQKIKGIQTGPISVLKCTLDIPTVNTGGLVTILLTQNVDGTGTVYATSVATNVTAAGTPDFFFFTNSIPANTDFYIWITVQSPASLFFNSGYIDGTATDYENGLGYDLVSQGSTSIGGLLQDLTFKLFTL